MDRKVLGRPLAVWIVAGRRIAIDVLIANLSLAFTAFLLRPEPSDLATLGLFYHLPLTVTAGAALALARTYRVSARYAGVADFTGVGFVALALGAGLYAATYLFPSVVVWQNRQAAAVLFSLVFVVMWLVSRWLLKVRQLPVIAKSNQGSAARTAMIVGAGDAGDMVCRELGRLQGRRIHIVGFVDDDPGKLGTTIQGIPVLGKTSDIPALTSRLGVDEIMVAIPSAGGDDMRRISKLCAETKAIVRTLPSFEAMVSSRGHVLSHMREIQFEDLLRRKSVADEIADDQEYLQGETVLITGGGGSIGSELARQVVPHSPASLILLGKGENSVFEINQELRHAGHKMAHPVVCDVRDRASMARVFERHKPSIVFHAAAHKHVPLMEDVPIEAIQNNVFGTLAVAEEAIRHGVKRFILVSTDKAVNPQNVMGATKRVAEMIVQSLAHRSETGFSAVRFGNVLGSRGSLVPIIQRQIKAGGPVTLTHPEMTRFFMTIPEAARLIVQAGAMGDHGEIFILDMGDPVKVIDLVYDMVRLYGFRPGEDIEVQTIGIRPGEKMHEELAYAAEDLQPSEITKISKVSSVSPLEWTWLKNRLEDLRALCDQGDTVAARAMLMDLAWSKSVPPSAAVLLEEAREPVE